MMQRMIHATLQASLTQARPPPAQWSQIAQSAAQREQQEQQALVVATPGLQNQIGEYNCFLNVVIQCLWHCTVFKARFSALAQGSPATVQVSGWSRSLQTQVSIAVVDDAPLHYLHSGVTVSRSQSACNGRMCLTRG